MTDANQTAEKVAEGRLDPRIYSVVNGKLMRRTATARIEMTMAEAAAELNHLRGLLVQWSITAPAFRSKPIGSPGSAARQEQELHCKLEDATNAALLFP